VEKVKVQQNMFLNEMTSPYGSPVDSGEDDANSNK
jgi:hypothetical protein